MCVLQIGKEKKNPSETIQFGPVLSVLRQAGPTMLGTPALRIATLCTVDRYGGNIY